MAEQSAENSANTKKIILPDPLSIQSKVNKHRVELSLPELANDEDLCVFAQKRADKLESLDWYTTPHPMLEEDHKNSSVSGRLISENLGAGYNEDVVIDGWLKSESHRSAIENKEYTKTCVATNKTLVVQIFSDK